MLKLSDNQIKKIAQFMDKEDRSDEVKDSATHTAITYISKLYNYLSKELPTIDESIPSEKLAVLDQLQDYLKQVLKEFGKE